jgi:hypothetical protein
MWLNSSSPDAIDVCITQGWEIRRLPSAEPSIQMFLNVSFSVRSLGQISSESDHRWTQFVLSWWLDRLILIAGNLLFLSCTTQEVQRRHPPLTHFARVLSNCLPNRNRILRSTRASRRSAQPKISRQYQSKSLVYFFNRTNQTF